MKREMFAAPRITVLCALSFPLLAAACGDNGTDAADQAKMQVQITDAPSDFIQTTDIWVSRVYLQGGPGHEADTTDTGTSGRVDLFNNPTAPFKADLMALRNGLTANLTPATTIDAGSYKQLRIVVDSAKVTLKSGYQFENGTTTSVLKIPSGSSSGVKVVLNSTLTADAGTTGVLLVDLDVNQNFVLQTSGNSAAVFRTPVFTPLIKEMRRTSTPGT